MDNCGDQLPSSIALVLGTAMTQIRTLNCGGGGRGGGGGGNGGGHGRPVSGAAQQQCMSGFQVQDFVVWTAAGHDAADPIEGTVEECEQACCADSTCVGFSRPKEGVSISGVAPDTCWLKRYLPESERTANNPQYHTYLNQARERRADAIVSGRHGPMTYTFMPTPANFRDANAMCRRQRGALASIHTQAEQHAVQELLQGQQLQCQPDHACGAWIGLNDNRREAGTDGLGFVWSDGTANVYDNWHPGEPSGTPGFGRRQLAEGGEDCGMMYADGTWNDENCNHVLPFVCEVRAGTHGQSPPPPPETPDYHYYPGPLNALAASDDCVVRGGQLASVHSQQELQAMMAAAPPTAQFWIGLNDASNEAGNSGNSFVWSDGTETTRGFSLPWNPGEPNSMGDEDCVMVYAANSGGKWNDQSCGTQMGYVCNINADSEAAGVYSDCVSLFHNDIIHLMEEQCYSDGEDESEAPSQCSGDCADIFLPFYQHCGQVFPTISPEFGATMGAFNRKCRKASRDDAQEGGGH